MSELVIDAGDDDDDSGGDVTVLEPREIPTATTSPTSVVANVTLNSAAPRQKRKAETEEFANILYNGDFDAWLNEQKQKWRRLRRARATVRELLDGARWLAQSAPQMEQIGEGLVRSAMLAQYERDLAKPPVMAAALRGTVLEQQ
jgi:hypothetical protein